MIAAQSLSMVIPNKSNFKFQELTPITGVKPYVIRFWETEFPEIAPISSENGQKLYARKDVEAILRIKKLLFEDKLTIQEAKVKMHGEEFEEPSVEVSHEEAANDMRPGVLKALDFIREIKARRNW